MPNRKTKRMMQDPVTRRNFLLATAAGTAPGLTALADPGTAAALSVGVKKSDMPDLTVKQVKVYVTDVTNIHRLNSTETGEILAVATNSGIEGNYAIGNRERTTGWLEWAKATLVGRNVVDLLPTLNATSGMKSAGGLNARPGRAAVGDNVPLEQPPAPQPEISSPYPAEAVVRGPTTRRPQPTSASGTFLAKRSVVLYYIRSSAARKTA